MKNDKRVTIQRLELKKLLFWAEWGLGRSRGGSGDNPTIKVIKKLSKRYFGKEMNPEIGKYL